VTDQPTSDQPSATNDSDAFPIDLNVARIARLENFLVGGDANFAVDRSVAEELAEAADDRLDGLRGVVVALKAFVDRTVRVLVGDAGVHQLLHIGMATPTGDGGMVHDIALDIAPDARVVYASYDPTTLAHVHVLGKDVPEGAVVHVQSSFGDPQKILRAAAATLDLDRPVAVILPTTLNLVADDTVARRIVDELRDAVVSGSYMALAHTSPDNAPESTAKIIEMLNAALDEPYVLRSEAEIARLLTGFDLLDPGLVPIEDWRNDGGPPVLASGHTVPILGAVGRKP
jgi:hypothetical protein